MMFTTVVMVINGVLMAIVVAFIITLFVYAYQIRQRLVGVLRDQKVRTMIPTDMEIQVPYIDIYTAQGRSSDLPDYFHEDIYRDLPYDSRAVVLQKDYFNIVIDVVETVLRNKLKLMDAYPKLRTKEALSLPYYIPCVKAAKFSVDYEQYLKDLNPRTLLTMLEEKYTNFGTDKKYFVTLTNKTCVKKVHIMYFIKIATDLYLDFMEEVNNCIYNKQCNYSPQDATTQQTQSCEI